MQLTQVRLEVHLDFAHVKGPRVALFRLAIELAGEPTSEEALRETLACVFRQQVRAYEERTKRPSEFAQMYLTAQPDRLRLTKALSLKGYDMLQVTPELVRRLQLTASYRKQSIAAAERFLYHARQAKNFLETLSGVPPPHIAPKHWQHLLTHWARRFAQPEVVSKSDMVGLARFLYEIDLEHGLPTERDLERLLRTKEVLYRVSNRRAPLVKDFAPPSSRSQPDRFEAYFGDPEVTRQFDYLSLWYGGGVQERLRELCKQQAANGAPREDLGTIS